MPSFLRPLILLLAIALAWSGAAAVNLHVGTGRALLSGTKVAGPIDPPAADLNFAANTGISGNITVARSTQETCEGPGLLVTYAPANTGCINSYGLQVFGAATNNFLHTQLTTGFGVANGAITVDSAGTAPDGVGSRLIFTDNSSSTLHQLNTSNTSFVAGTNYTFSIYLQQGTCAQATHECRYVSLSPSVAVGAQFMSVDLSTCQRISSNAGLVKYKIIKLADPTDPTNPNPASPVCHVYFTFSATNTIGSGGLIVAMMSEIPQHGAVNQVYVGAGSTIYFWGSQSNTSSSFFPYCPNPNAAAITCNADVIATAGTLKSALEGAALRAVFTVSDFREGQPSTLLGVGTALTGLGIAAGYQAQTNWPTTTTIKSAGQIVQGAQINYIGLSADASGRSLAMNGQTAVSDANGLSASAAERIGSLSTSAAFCDCNITELKVWNTRNDANMLAATAGTLAAPSVALPLVASYTGAVAGNTRLHHTLLAAATATQSMSRTYHRFSENGTSIQFKFANYYITGGTTAETAPGAAATITGSIEYPAGVCTPFLWSGLASGNIPDGGTLITDALSINYVAGDHFWIRDYRTNTAGIIVENLLGENNVYGGEVIHFGTTGITDQTVSCDAITSTTSAENYWPDVIVGPTQLHSYCLIGDSRTRGAGDSGEDATGAVGQIAHWVQPYYSYINMGAGGDSAQHYITNGTQRRVNLQYCTGMIVQFGNNDIFTSGRTPVQLEADLLTVYGYNSLLNGGSGPVWADTVDYQTTSSNSWINTAGQTTSASLANEIIANAWIRANTAGIAGYFETNDPIYTARDSGIYKSNGLVFGWTPEGLHATPLGYLTIMNSIGFPAQLH